jgi:hypothetical protein
LSRFPKIGKNLIDHIHRRVHGSSHWSAERQHLALRFERSRLAPDQQDACRNRAHRFSQLDRVHWIQAVGIGHASALAFESIQIWLDYKDGSGSSALRSGIDQDHEIPRLAEGVRQIKSTHAEIFRVNSVWKTAIA